MRTKEERTRRAEPPEWKGLPFEQDRGLIHKLGEMVFYALMTIALFFRGGGRSGRGRLPCGFLRGWARNKTNTAPCWWSL
jgi:hypothetical protein